MSANRIDQATPVRISTNLDVQRQTPKDSFGDRVNVGLQTTAGVVAQGAGVIAPFIPGGAIVSAAVSSVGTMSNGAASGQSSYASTGTVSAVGAGVINTTVSPGGNIGGSVGPVGGSVGGTVGGTTGGVGGISTGGAVSPGSYNDMLTQMQADNQQMIMVQNQMQHESQVFSTISNVLKVRSDTVKNTIQNVH